MGAFMVTPVTEAVRDSVTLFPQVVGAVDTTVEAVRQIGPLQPLFPKCAGYHYYCNNCSRRTENFWKRRNFIRQLLSSVRQIGPAIPSESLQSRWDFDSTENL